MLTEEEKQWAVAMKNKIEIVREQAKKKGKQAAIAFVPEFLPPGHGKKLRGTCACVTKMRQKVFGWVMDSTFDNVMMTIILFNMAVLAAQYYDQSDTYVDICEILNRVFSHMFQIELLFKLFGMGCKQYCKDVWNRLDGAIVLVDLASAIAGGGPAVSLLRTLRVLRLVRLIKGIKGLRSLATTLYLSIPSLGNVGIMLVLILYVYAILGMNLFYNVKHRQSIDSTYNFSQFWPALVTLTRLITLDGWRGIMLDLMVSEPDCSPAVGDVETNCGSWLAVPFCFTFIILGNFLMLNIFTAVILRNFADAAMDEGLAGEGFLSQSLFKMNQLDTYLGEFQRRYRVCQRRKEKPIWLYSSWDHSVNPAYCAECGTIPCMAQVYDPVLEIMVSPHTTCQPVKQSPVQPQIQELTEGNDAIDIVNNMLVKHLNEDTADPEAVLDSPEYKKAYEDWANQQPL